MLQKDRTETALKRQLENGGGLMTEKNEMILVIDDENLVRSMVCEMLSGMGYGTYGFSDPVEAVDFYRLHFSDIPLVLIDMIMPGLNGRETFFLMKKANPDIRAVIFSGSDMNEDIEKVVKESGVVFLKKPVNYDSLQNSVEAALKMIRCLSDRKL
jgi:DNA-binding NtrC family response regulator